MPVLVMRLRGEMHRPRKLPSPVHSGSQFDLQRLDFPFDRINDLVEAATCFRDKALYCLLAASGIRLHEALNLTLNDVDFSNRLVYVHDPQEKRFGRENGKDEKRRYKGRTYSKTFLFEPYKTLFFEHLEQYLERERVHTNEHVYLFQIVERKRRGTPLKEASYAALEKSFKKTVQRAKIAGPAVCPDHVWTPHSLRHAYGIYMLNHIQYQHGQGLSIEEVQILMGHRSIDSTRHYARTDRLLLEAKLAEADAKINCFDEGKLYASIMEKLETSNRNS